MSVITSLASVLFRFSPHPDLHSERSRPGVLKVPQATLESLLRIKERGIWPEKLVPGRLPAELCSCGVWGYGCDQHPSLESCMPTLDWGVLMGPARCLGWRRPGDRFPPANLENVPTPKTLPKIPDLPQCLLLLNVGLSTNLSTRTAPRPASTCGAGE